jgi:hypothetical protein
MLNRRWSVGLIVVVVALAIGGYRWWTSDERAIRGQLSVVATTLSGTSGDDTFAAIGRLATLRKTLAPDLHVSAGPAPAEAGVGDGRPIEIDGRDQALALFSRWIPPPGGIAVAFVDVQITIGTDRTSAQVYCTATITSRGASGERNIDARELTIGFTKVAGDWLVASVRAEETLVP